MIYRNKTMIEELIGIPKLGVFSIVDEEKKLVYVCVVKNSIAWISRNAIDIANGCHKYKFDSSIVINCEYEHRNINILRLKHSQICAHYINAGYKVLGANRPSKYSVKFVVKGPKVHLRIVNSRNKVLYSREFNKMITARAYFNGHTIEEMLSEDR